MDIAYEKLSAPELRQLMVNARRLQNAEVYASALSRLCELAPDADHSTSDMADPLVQRFWQAVTAAEQIRTQANGKTTRLQRTRNKAAAKGVLVTMADLAMKADPSEGFDYLVQAGLPHLVFEYVIAEMPARFDDSVVAAAYSRLDKFGIPRPPTSPSAGMKSRD